MQQDNPFEALKQAQAGKPQAPGDERPKETVTPPPAEQQPETQPPLVSQNVASTQPVRKARDITNRRRPAKITGYVAVDMKQLLGELSHKPRANGEYPNSEAEVIAWLLDLGRQTWESSGKPPMP